jgi:hypothetical protein
VTLSVQTKLAQFGLGGLWNRFGRLAFDGMSARRGGDHAVHCSTLAMSIAIIVVVTPSLADVAAAQPPASHYDDLTTWLFVAVGIGALIVTHRLAGRAGSDREDSMRIGEDRSKGPLA